MEKFAPYEDMVEERARLMVPKANETAHTLAMDIVALLELIAIHGSSGIGGESKMRNDYVDWFESRINDVIK